MSHEPRKLCNQIRPHRSSLCRTEASWRVLPNPKQLEMTLPSGHKTALHVNNVRYGLDSKRGTPWGSSRSKHVTRCTRCALYLAIRNTDEPAEKCLTPLDLRYLPPSIRRIIPWAAASFSVSVCWVFSTWAALSACPRFVPPPCPLLCPTRRSSFRCYCFVPLTRSCRRYRPTKAIENAKITRKTRHDHVHTIAQCQRSSFSTQQQ